jgi:hypothetical protein
MHAIERTGRIWEDGTVTFDEPLNLPPVDHARFLILLPDESDIPEHEWRRFLARNSAFEFLNNPAEDIYSLSDGVPFRDKG